MTALSSVPGVRSSRPTCLPSTVNVKPGWMVISSVLPSAIFTTNWSAKTATTVPCFTSIDEVPFASNAADGTSNRIRNRVLTRVFMIASPLSFLFTTRLMVSLRSLFAAVRPHGADDEALRGGADEIERIAGDERQRGLVRGVEHVDPGRRYDGHAAHDEALHAGSHPQLDDVVHGDVFQRAEEAVAMPGDARVAARAGRRRVGDPPEPPVERDLVGAGENRRLEAEPRDRENRDRRLGPHLQRLPERRDALRRPERGVGLPAAGGVAGRRRRRRGRRGRRGKSRDRGPGGD